MILRETLRAYQREDADIMINAKRFYNGNDMGLGKTITTLFSIQELEGYPCLIVGPKFSLSVWQVEIKKWLGMDAIVYTGKPKEREQAWKDFIVSGSKFLITNYAMLPEIGIRSGIKVKESRTSINCPGSFKWSALICDELHMSGIFSHKSKTYDIAHKIAKDVDILFLLTGTPFRQGCVDFYGPLSLVDYEKFNSYWKFVNTFCVTIATPFGKEIERNPANVVRFRQMLSHYFIHRVKDEVLDELPGKQRQPLFVDMSPKQRKLYDELTAELIAMVPDSNEIVIAPGQLPLMVKQRLILACPQEFGLKERGAAIDAIIEHSHLSLDSNKPIIVYTPFRKALKWLRNAFTDEYPDVKIYEIRGQLTTEEFGKAWQGFQNDRHPRKVMFCIIKAGASFQATAASTGYFLGYEWDFNLDEQAEDRMNRMGQKNFVNIYYVMTRGTIDDKVAEKLNDKKSASNWVIGTDEQYLKMLKGLKGQQ